MTFTHDMKMIFCLFISICVGTCIHFSVYLIFQDIEALVLLMQSFLIGRHACNVLKPKLEQLSQTNP